MVVQWASDFAAAAAAHSDTVKLQSCQETSCSHDFRLIVSGDSRPGVFPADWVPSCFESAVLDDTAVKEGTSGEADDEGGHTPSQALRGDSEQDVDVQDASLQDASLQDASLQDTSWQDASLDDVCTEEASSDNGKVSDGGSVCASKEEATLQHSGGGGLSHNEAAVEYNATLGRETEAALKVLRRGGHVAVVGGALWLLQ